MNLGENSTFPHYRKHLFLRDENSFYGVKNLNGSEAISKNLFLNLLL